MIPIMRQLNWILLVPCRRNGIQLGARHRRVRVVQQLPAAVALATDCPSVGRGVGAVRRAQARGLLLARRVEVVRALMAVWRVRVGIWRELLGWGLLPWTGDLLRIVLLLLLLILAILLILCVWIDPLLAVVVLVRLIRIIRSWRGRRRRAHATNTDCSVWRCVLE
jgi:hypothetical protein